MSAEVLIPATYSEWRHCIENRCRETLTRAWCEKRIIALRDSNDAHTQSFLKLYGRAHLDLVIGWFERARAGAAI